MSALIRIGVTAAIALAVGCGQNKFQREVETESAAVKLARETAAGDYELVTTEELKALIAAGDDFALIDAMPYEDSFKKEHLAGAKNFLFPKDAVDTDDWDADACDGKSQDDFAALLGDDKDALIVTYCGFVKCARSHNAAAWARQMGYTNVKRYAGGIYAWKGAGHKTESGD